MAPISSLRVRALDLDLEVAVGQRLHGAGQPGDRLGDAAREQQADDRRDAAAARRRASSIMLRIVATGANTSSSPTDRDAPPISCRRTRTAPPSRPSPCRDSRRSMPLRASHRPARHRRRRCRIGVDQRVIGVGETCECVRSRSSAPTMKLSPVSPRPADRLTLSVIDVRRDLERHHADELAGLVEHRRRHEARRHAAGRRIDARNRRTPPCPARQRGRAADKPAEAALG